MLRRAVVWRAGVLAAWLGALAVLAGMGDGSAWPYVLIGFPLGVAVGFLVDRWWIVFAPFAIQVTALVVYVVGSLASGDCRDCTDGDGLGFLIIWGAVIFALPATAALLLGVGARRALRRSPRPLTAPRLPRSG